ncbi:PAS domain-containing sensor histidine kinase [Mucilaginibacter mali]|uniref:histidine kinase n=1 Tax=Mucilaginibacter mali TaxID=2740462 RepID=A0A7D4TPZ3_9SPHI|nr:PAS domain-containing sensor histidine kinase [Mucilaginibacter mali]QKJ32213.1 PAS domain-containing sensor histidine kinase [Mucilaginibacter mali]
MEKQQPSYHELLNEITELRWQLEEANDAIEAIRNGGVDALVVNSSDGPQLFTLKSADQSYRVFVEKMNEGAISLNRDGVILYSNSKFAQLVGLPLEKVIGRSFDNFILQSEHEKLAEIIKGAWEKDCKVELLIVSRMTTLVPCLLSCNIMEFDGAVAMSVIVTDLSAQKESQQQLELQFDQLEAAQLLTKKLNDELEETVKERTKDLTISREYLKLLTDNIPQMTWTNLPGGTFNFYNQRWYEYTGLSHDAATGRGWEDVIHPDDLPLTTERYLAALQHGDIFEVENRYRKADGTYQWHLNRAIPLKNDQGEILFWVGTATNIEDQKRAMDKKDEFIGIASHELKTPLTSLKGYLQIMNIYHKETVPHAIKQYISKANVAIDKLHHLINDLLDVSKIQAGRLTYQMADINLAGMVGTGVENAAQIYPEYQFDHEVEPNLMVHGNPERLEQVLMNFISNAAKYSKEGSRIMVKAKALDGHVRVSVTDEGIGLSPGQQEKIFERFYRVEDKTYSTSGLGMGLYISAEIIKNHKGSIHVESHLGQGSTFYFELPLVR